MLEVLPCPCNAEGFAGIRGVLGWTLDIVDALILSCLNHLIELFVENLLIASSEFLEVNFPSSHRLLDYYSWLKLSRTEEKSLLSHFKLP